MFRRHSLQSGQTLIETVVAVFILVMGITAALGLATFSLHSSTNTVKQLIGVGLAREGIEAVKNMRDTNWLQDTLVPAGCYNYVTGTNNSAPCYRNWLNPTASSGGYNINPGTSKSYIVLTNPVNPVSAMAQPNYYWSLQNVASFGLKYDANATNGSYYYAPSGGATPGDKDGFGTYYAREVVITRQSLAPYNSDSNGNYDRLMVQSHVWWTDQNCPAQTTFAAAKPACRIELTIYLTNWKNYQ